LYPNVPTIAERAYSGFEALSWVGIGALKGVPKKSEIDQWVSLLKKSGIKPE
jgi:tripartite-type tricarboxylate transporter receptor subunit TctC